MDITLLTEAAYECMSPDQMDAFEALFADADLARRYANCVRKRLSAAHSHCQCQACASGTIHASDCAVHNAPALPIGSCDCGAQPDERAAFIKAVQSLVFLCRTESKRLDNETLAALDNVENHLVAMGASVRDDEGELHGASAASPQSGEKGDPFPYQKTFNAIAAATSIEGGHIAISVRKFCEAFGEASATAPQATLTPEAILDAFERAGMRLDPTPNALYTVRGQHAQLIEGARSLLTQAPTERMSDDRDSVIHALQKALAYWMPKVFDERSAHDAYLLVGYEGETETRCWGDEMIDALPRWTPVGEALPDEPGFYLVMLAPDNDWGLMADTPLQVEFIAYNNKPKAFTCLYDYRADEDITEAITHWMPMPSVPNAARKAEIERREDQS